MPPQVASPVLVGRDDEVAALERALDMTVDGRPTLLTVSGEAGMGKTRLLTELARRGAERGFTVVSGACIDMGESAVPLAPVAEALRDLRRHLGDDVARELIGDALPTLAPFLPGLGDESLPSPPSRHALLERLRDLVERLAAQAPVGLIVEDLHWSDPSSRDVLAYLARRVTSGPLLMAWSYRADEMHRRHPLVPFLAEIERAARPVHIDLAPLAEDRVGDFVTAVRGTPGSAEEVSRLHARSGGNPFYLEELLAARDDGSLPPGLKAVLGGRLATLRDADRALVHAASVVGAVDVEESLMRALVDLPVDEVRDGLRRLVDANVLRPAADGYAFRHALLQEVAYADLLPGERIDLHERLARALEGAEGADAAARRARHWYEARNLSQALGASVEAGVAAYWIGGTAEAVMQFERALELWDRVPDAEARAGMTRADLLDRAARANCDQGRFPRARALHAEAISRVDPVADPVRAALLHERMGRTLATSGEDDPLPVLTRALELVPAEPPSSERARVLAGLAGVLMKLRRRDAVRVARDAVQAAIAAGDPCVEGHARCTLGVALADQRRLDESLDEMRRARVLSEEHGSPDDMGRVWQNLTYALAARGDWPELVDVGLEGVRWSEGKGLGCAGGAGISFNVAEGLYVTGRWDEARAIHASVASRVQGTGWAYLAAHPVWTESGEFDRVRAVLASAELPSDPAAAAVAGLDFAVAAVGVALWEGRPADARALAAGTLARMLDHVPEMVLDDGWSLLWRAFWAEADLAREGGDTVVAELQETLRRAGFTEQGALAPVCAPHAALCEAEAARAVDPSDVAPWRRALEATESRAYESAYARFRLAEALLAGGSADAEVEGLLRDAWVATTAMGARPLAGLVERTALRARIRLGDAAPIARDPDAPYGLTVREREVLALVAEGLTNGQIADRLVISRKTASVHVSNILAKLGARTRGEAAAIAHREGLSSHV